MGYRSDVAYVVKFHSDNEPEKAFAEFLKFVNWVKTDHKTYLNPQDERHDKDAHTYEKETKDSDALKIHHDSMMLSYSADSVKWYPDYYDVQWHEQLLDKLHTYETGNYRFVRVGEDYEDVEVKEHNPTTFELFDYVDVYRGINLSLPSEPQDKEAV